MKKKFTRNPPGVCSVNSAVSTCAEVEEWKTEAEAEEDFLGTAGSNLNNSRSAPSERDHGK